MLLYLYMKVSKITDIIKNVRQALARTTGLPRKFQGKGRGKKKRKGAAVQKTRDRGREGGSLAGRTDGLALLVRLEKGRDTE